MEPCEAQAGPFLPYCGSVRSAPHRPGQQVRSYGLDSGQTHGGLDPRWRQSHIANRANIEEWHYRFNQLGYRGEEFDPAAKHHIVACGCSYTFGCGIEWEQTYAYQFKCRFAEEHALASSDVNLLNFSQGGASNDYICRTLLEQLRTFRPSLVIAYFTHQARKEFVDEQGVYRIGPWQIDQPDPFDPAVSFFTYYTVEAGYINALRNLLIAQYFLKSRRIPYLFAWADLHHLESTDVLQNRACQPYFEQIDKTFLADFTLESHDLARDQAHPGAQSNTLFADRLFDFYINSLSHQPVRHA